MAELKEVPTEELLSFHDFPETHTTGRNVGPFGDPQIKIDIKADNFDNYDNPTETKTNLDDLDSPIKTGVSPFTIEYIQQYFNVDTDDVKRRILASFIPRRDSILSNEIKTRPDLYGPLWISVTLNIAVAISGNIANYLQSYNTQYDWKYDFHMLTYASTALYFYMAAIPLGLWLVLKWSLKDNDSPDTVPSPMELICIYGYSLFVFIPAAILWTIQITWLQWLLLIVTACLSGSVLISRLSSSLSVSRHKIILYVAVLGFHFLLAFVLLINFFHGEKSEVVPGSTTPKAPSISPSVAPSGNLTHAGKV